LPISLLHLLQLSQRHVALLNDVATKLCKFLLSHQYSVNDCHRHVSISVCLLAYVKYTYFILPALKDSQY